MQNSKIEWCHHTHNIVWGCLKVSPGCQNCYAETLAHRYGYKVWGPAKTTERRTMSDNYWKQPKRWHKQAEQIGEQRRVFCGSMCDVFEDHPTNNRERARLWETIGECDRLDWLLLTKRPENILQMVPPAYAAGYWPDNVWIGTSVESQEQAEKRIPELLKVPAKVRFLSCEPLLGPVDLGFPFSDNAYMTDRHVDWVIVGGESGHGARPMHPEWARSLRDQCQAAGVAFHFKQWGEYVQQPWNKPNPKPAIALMPDGYSTYAQVGHVAGFVMPGEVCMERVGKHAAGRVLDGREWNEVPQ